MYVQILRTVGLHGGQHIANYYVFFSDFVRWVVGFFSRYHKVHEGFSVMFCCRVYRLTTLYVIYI